MLKMILSQGENFKRGATSSKETSEPSWVSALGRQRMVSTAGRNSPTIRNDTARTRTRIF